MNTATPTKIEASPRPPVPSPSPSPSPSRGTPASEGEAKVMYMLFSFLNGPIAYQLYAVKVPNLSLLTHSKHEYDPSKEITYISPILEFSSEMFPRGMSCVELDGTFYLLGGTTRESDFLDGGLPEFPRDVHTVTVDPTRFPMGLREGFLERGTPMISGKPEIYTFVAEKRIYALVASYFWRDLNKEMKQFEVFDPLSKQWTALPDPPIESDIEGHAVVNDVIFIVSSDRHLFSFDIVTRKWVDYKKRLPYSIFGGKAELIDDTLYACSRRTPVAYRITSGTEDGSRIFDDVVHLSQDMKAVYDYVLLPEHDACLVHLGNRFFCYVVTGSLSSGDDDSSDDDSSNLGIKLAFFQAQNETYAGSGGMTYFRAQFLDFIHLFSKMDMSSAADCLPHCFPISYSATKEYAKGKRQALSSNLSRLNKQSPIKAIDKKAKTKTKGNEKENEEKENENFQW